MNHAVRRHVREVVGRWVAADRHGRVAGVRITRSAYASSATLLNVHLALAGGERLRVVYKLGARGSKPDFVHDPHREPWTYRSVPALEGLADAPRLLATGHVAGHGPWMLMEWAGSVDLGQVGSRAVWCEAAARLARIHAWGESRVDELSGRSLLRWDDPGLHMRLARRAARAGGALPRSLLGRYRAVADRLAAMPKTLVHGDLNASNVLVSRAGGTTRIRIIDWETVGIGPALLDLAAITSGRLPARHRAGMVAAYRESLGASDLVPLADGEFEHALCLCRLALAVQWLGWSPGWSPPPAHAHDWRAEAETMARRVGLLDQA